MLVSEINGHSCRLLAQSAGCYSSAAQCSYGKRSVERVEEKRYGVQAVDIVLTDHLVSENGSGKVVPPPCVET